MPLLLKGVVRLEPPRACDAKNTKTDLKAEGIDVIRVWIGNNNYYKEEEQEAVIESLHG